MKTSAGFDGPAREEIQALTFMFLARFWRRVCVASTCSTSEVPMPKAREPKAPWVAVCESPQTTVVPGRVNPCVKEGK
jgi:hypothetical protein